MAGNYQQYHIVFQSVTFKTLNANYILKKSCNRTGSFAFTIRTRRTFYTYKKLTTDILIRFNGSYLFQVNVLINEQHLKDEIAYLQKHKKVHTQLVAALKCENLEMLGLARDRRESMDEDVYFKSERLSLLLKWCKIICSYYGMKVCVVEAGMTTFLECLDSIFLYRTKCGFAKKTVTCFIYPF